LKCVVKAIGEVGGADKEGQFHDLLLVVILSQLFKDILPDSGWSPCDKQNKMEGGFVLLIEGFTALKEE